MSASKALCLLAFIVAAGTAAIALLNYRVDPLCYFNCPEVTLDKHTLNDYYQNAQRVLQHPKTEMIIVASSRGESIPLKFLTDITGLPAINLSVGGGEIHAKTAFLQFAQSHLRLKKVIWVADYFELIDENATDKIRYTEALRRLAPDLPDQKWNKLSLLIEHNTIEASFALMKRKPKPLDSGASASVDATGCSQTVQRARLTPKQLAREIGIVYDGYAHKILQPHQQEKSWQRLKSNIQLARQNGTEFILVIPSYHRDFMARLRTEFPEIAARHDTWLKRLKGLESEGARVLDFFEKLPGDDGTPRYWSDGVHFTCHAAMEMLRDHLR